MVASLFLLASSSFELGGAAGIGRIMGDPAVAVGRDASVADPIRLLWSGSGWAGYQWMRGHTLAIRYDHSIGSGRIDNQQDLGEDLRETLVLGVYGLEYVRTLPRKLYRLRLGGGLGYAKARDLLDMRDLSLTSRGEGIGVWVRSGIEVPLVAELRLHLDGLGQWTSFAAMKSEGLDTYKTSFSVLRIETGLSLGL